MKTQLYINGQWQKGADGEFEVFNPATQAVIAKVQSADETQAKLAIEAAEKAQNKWQQYQPRQRGEILRSAFELIIKNSNELAELITLENGKAKAESLAEIKYSAEFFRWFSEQAVRSDGLLKQAPSSGAKIMVHHKPAGVAVLITPWNYPAAMATRKIAPALAAGCGVVLKPAAETPLTMLALMPLLEEAGVPAGLVNVVMTKRSRQVVATMLSDKRTRVVSFTGSTEVGKHLLKQAANQVLIPAMELGGNAPVIIFEDADMDKTIDGVMLAKMRNLGEACTAANRIYVHQSIAKKFTKRLVETMSKLKMGNGLDDGVDVGSLINKDTRDKVHHLVQDAINKGAKLQLGGQIPAGKGYFYPPTVLSNVSDDALGFADEIFGPVAMIQSFAETEAIIKKANQTRYGLVAYVFTEDFKKGIQVCEQLDFGMVGLNRGLVSDPAAPFGGMKESGLGREGAYEGMMEFMETQYISLNW